MKENKGEYMHLNGFEERFDLLSTLGRDSFRVLGDW